MRQVGEVGAQLVFRMQEILADQLPTIALYYRRFYWVYDNQAYTPMNTWGGLMDGLPFVQNKLSFLSRVESRES